MTTIVIAHRLSTIRNADKIIVMQTGKIIEQGNHEYLLRYFPDGLYAKMLEEQENFEAISNAHFSFVEAEGADPVIRKSTLYHSCVELRNSIEYKLEEIDKQKKDMHD